MYIVYIDTPFSEELSTRIHNYCQVMLEVPSLRSEIEKLASLLVAYATSQMGEDGEGA
jgi:hypothetical protein